MTVLRVLKEILGVDNAQCQHGGRLPAAARHNTPEPSIAGLSSLLLQLGLYSRASGLLASGLLASGLLASGY